MATITEVNYNEIIQKVQDLPDSLQIHFIEYLNFLHFKYNTMKSDNSEMLSNEDREELQRRIKKSQDHPETLVTWGNIIADIEETFGRKIKIH
jgi:wyosine [tRNA(Phe)-imidazoG37] synthetase (radical SAM superfamily)